MVYKNRSSYATQNRTLRNSNDLPLIIPKTTLIKDSFIYNGIKMYNKLPTEIKNKTSYKLFRSTLQKRLASRAYYDLTEYFKDDSL